VEHRVRFADLFDAEVRPHHERLMAAAAIRPGEDVLDVGCGTGQTTRDAARAAGNGTVLGVDLSGGMLDLARRRSDDAGLRNVSYERADAQAHPFPAAAFDVCLSRFGVMFFADPVVAFRNLGAALRPGGRLALMVWQGSARNGWAEAIVATLSAGPFPAPATDESPFSLGDPMVTEGVLSSAGFADVGMTAVDEPVNYGPDVATACEFVLGLRDAKTLLSTQDEATAARSRERLRRTLSSHLTPSGVLLPSSAWLITATWPGPRARS
jgi:SAM-dependent methyltransferase